MIKNIKIWIKTKNSPLSGKIYWLLKKIRSISFPVIYPVHHILYHLHKLVVSVLANVLRVVYWTPLFKSRLENNPKQLLLYGGMPLLLGPVSIFMGSDCRVSGVTTICGRSAGKNTPMLIVGNNVDISWQNEIFVGNRIELGDNVRLAVKVRLVGYPGHPIEPVARARGLPDTDNQVGDIFIENDVWLAAGVTVMGGVRIGAGTIVASGSIVTKDLPANVLAAGIPAKVIKHLDFD